MSIARGPRIVTDGLVLYLDIASPDSYSGSGSTVYDLSVNKNADTLYNTPTYSVSKAGTLIFNGSNQYARTNTSILNPSSNQDISHFIWVRPTSQGQIVTEIDNAGGWHDANIEVSSSGGFLFSIWHGSLTNRVTSANLGLSKWYYVGLTYSYSNTLLTAYINGRPIGTTTFTRSTTTSLKYDLMKGDSTNMIGVTAYVAGSMGTFKVYKRPLTASEILQNYNAQKARYQS